MRKGIYTDNTSTKEYHLDFDNYVKHLRFYSNQIDCYHHKEVEKKFYKALGKLGNFNDGDLFAFITLRLKSKSDWVIANNTSNALEWKLCKYFWGRYGKKLLETNNAPYVASIEHNLYRIKDHIHAIIKLDNLRCDYDTRTLETAITAIALSIKEVNEENSDAVKVSIFPFSHNSSELGNKIEYICKTSSKHHDPLSRKILSQHQQEAIIRKL